MMTFDLQNLPLLEEAAQVLDKGFGHLPDYEPAVDRKRMRDVLRDVARRLHDNYPYQHPLYAGQMLKPPHPIARLAYALAMFINPNNHALDGGRASSAMEKEAVAEIAKILGWERHLGHLCSGGTMANMEALWIAGRLHPGTTIIASTQAHYTHSRISNVLQLDFQAVPVDAQARMDLDLLERIVQKGHVGTVVATLGTTATGAVDPLPDILDLRERYGFRVHVDAAYGGYFTLVENLNPQTRAAFDCLERADSVVVDPHKHGLQPYGCGCVMFRDPSVGRMYKHDSPYTYFTSGELHLGEISLECSRAGASAVALWATLQLLPLTKDGEFSRALSMSRDAATALYDRLRIDARHLVASPPELDIVIWAPAGPRTSVISEKAQDYFRAAADADLHLALVTLPGKLFEPYWDHVEFDQETVTCLRSCLMKPDHHDWLDRIWAVLDSVVGEI